MTTHPRGKIVTFYSYKGGVGRSMALANVGVLLAQMGKRVLLVDWDLEAPGLEHYFANLTVSRPKQHVGGLLALLNHAPDFGEEAAKSAVTTYRVDRRSEISILESGAESLTYATTLADFAWSDYFAKKQGGQFLEQLRDHWIANYDYVLIDSRTGVTDSGGICTILMPDVLFLLFAANQQNLNGILKIGKLARQGRGHLYYSRSSLPILPIPSRFDGRVEKAIASKWLSRISIDCLDLYSDWIVDGIECKTLIEQIKIPYIPQYSFDEGLPVISEGTSDPEQIGYYYRNIATLLSNDEPFDGEFHHAVQENSPLIPRVNVTVSPKVILQVFVSSTFSDLMEHRRVLVQAIAAQGMHPVVMENDSAKAYQDAIDSAINLVRDCSAYIAILGLKYGQTPECPTRNPDRLSITELEFNEALRLERPILLFIMSEDHPVKKADIERDPEKEKKLNAFRERAKRVTPDSRVNRVYADFNSLEEFKDKLGSSLAELSRHLKPVEGDTAQDRLAAPQGTGDTFIPKPPSFYAEPDYIGSHKFVGRAAELQVLTDWGAPSDPTNLLLLEGIGGNGKSMLTWEWTTNPRHALAARPADQPWAGRFWYSFYERGAIMADFCQHALAYMTGRPLEDFAKKKTAELKEEFLAQLRAKPWLLILDGLERILVAYHRIDAAEVPDEEANIPTDKIVNRNPCDAIRDEDNDLLRALAGVAPSKLLVSTRLTPRVLLNPSGQPIPGAKRITLPGLRPPDAEALLRSCGIEGNSDAIRSYLTTNCDNHPLVIGILGGLIANYLPARGDFDIWSAAPEGGSALDLASLDLIQRRNHILDAAIKHLPDASRQLLSTLALLTDSVDYETLKAFNPHLPPDQKKLAETVKDLEQRGLLKWDSRTREYDLHAVVRGAVAGQMNVAIREHYGQRVVDHFHAQPHRPYEEAETMEDVRSGMHVVRTLLKLGRYQQAADAYRGDFSRALLFNLNAYAETLSLLKPFFPHGWDELPKEVGARDSSYLAACAALALDSCGELAAALAAYGAVLRAFWESEDWTNTAASLSNISLSLVDQNRFAQALRTTSLSLEVATLNENMEGVFMGRLILFAHHSRLGQWTEAAATWSLLDPMGRDWSRAVYRPGRAERLYAEFHFWQGSLQETHLAEAEHLAAQGKDRTTIRALHRLRGDWRLIQGEWAVAAASYQEAVRLARERSLTDADSETGLALAKHHLGQLPNPREEAERLAQLRNPAHRYLAMLWLALGDTEQAKKHALAAYKDAWADGEPYVNCYELTQTTALLRQMNVPIPKLPPYDPAKDEKLPWEDEVRAAIEKLRAEKEAKKKAKKRKAD